MRTLIGAVLFFSVGALAQTVPSRVSFTARLVDNGVVVQGSRNFVFKLFPTAVLGSEVWSETRNSVNVVDGNVNLDLGASTPLTETLFDGQTLYLEVTVGATVLSPRTPVLSVPYALRSNVAAQVGTLTPAQIQKRVTSACGIGTAIQVINADGTVVCQAAGATTDAGVSTITSITAGAGLTGGGAIGNIPLAVAFGGQGSGSGTQDTVARFDHTHAYLPLGPMLTCALGFKMTGLNGGTGNPICVADTTYGAATNGGLILSSGSQFSLMACSLNQVLVAGSGGTWSCANPPGVASVSATTPLSSTGGATPVLSLGTVPVANGGTGAITVSGARAALAAAGSGANGDITSLTGLTTPLSGDQGGTGITPPGTAGRFLKSTTTGWTAGSIIASEVPSGSTSYIQNLSSQQTGTFWVTGVARTSGLLRTGSESGTTQGPRVDSSGGYQGVVTRAINSVFTSAGQVVARTDVLTFERDGTNNGFRITKVTSDAQRGYVMCQGFDSVGTTKNKVVNVGAGVAINTSLTVYLDTDDMVHFSCNFGTLDTATSNTWHHSTITLSRTNTGTYWAGMLHSTFNQ